MDNPETLFSQAVYNFNYCPCQYIDITWLTQPLPWLENLGGWRKRPALNQWCLREWGVTPVSETAFNVPSFSLALLPLEPLNDLIIMVGGVLHCQAMRHIVLKEPKQHLNSVFGMTGARYCIQQGPMLLSNWPLGWQKSLPSQFDCVGLKTRARELGLVWFNFLLRDAPESLHQRWRFKLKSSESVSQSSSPWLDVNQHDLAYQLTKKIAKQVIPQCFHLLK
ncbi:MULTISPECIES: SctK family type III secretion system sorting platform protein VscK [Vibrio]|uniref:SctK family type III secretion system sorting platform protein VscK n=1 Tax=Vibrio TaxID=662 RepID=UPI0005717E99|nr:SctK family type III secretion system sorting platform protein VscK [Vibrio pacinii]